ncbi:plasmid replication, integration and excision activator [Brevibacterium casei]|uniref:plasmid replication, integration and excision activator n=1 Tax=Brevibacterium casei TaxID=33889 RepID=UPI00223A9F2A|nr:plasmid replication, integration and excision activator [Brevibacterium casei]MCT1765939.1 plasmid replication, integration and excision activator [Brevibacterium casei]MCT2183058.1 plasmid replication, integration and excision activator [Brevibacterium casei]
MAMQRRFPVDHADVFPAGAFLKGGLEPVADFNAERRADGSRPQQLDKDSGLPMWQVMVLDADEEAGKKETAISIKIAAKVQPVPPENTTPFPWTPVEFVGLTALAYVDDNGNRPRLAWSFRAESLKAPGKAAASGSSAEKVA